MSLDLQTARTEDIQMYTRIPPPPGFGIIYMLENKVNGKKYVGQTCYSLKQRFRRHRSKSKINCRAISAAIKKYGTMNFKGSILEKCPLSSLDRLEQRHIFLEQSLAPGGYNLTTGGDKGAVLSESTKQMKTEAAKRQFGTPEARKMLRDNSAARKDERLASFHDTIDARRAAICAQACPLPPIPDRVFGVVYRKDDGTHRKWVRSNISKSGGMLNPFPDFRSLGKEFQEKYPRVYKPQPMP